MTAAAQPQRTRFEDIEVGQSAELSHRLTSDDVAAFAGLTGDNNPLHLDGEFARETGFREPVVHGMLSASFVSTMIGTVLPGPGALWTSQSLEFLRPAHVGDELRVVAKVTQKSVATRMLVLEISVFDQNDNTLISGEAKVKVPEPRTQESRKVTDESTNVVVTGAARGIGASIARRLAADGHAVVINYASSADDAEQLAAEIGADGGRAVAVRADVSKPDEVEALFAAARDAFGPVGALVHGAAVPSSLQAMVDSDWDAMQRQIDVQVRGAFACSRAALEDMNAAGHGSIVFIGSVASDGVPPANQSDYVVAKAALASMARCLAVECGPQGVAVNTVSPGMTNTLMIADLPEKAKMLTRTQTPLRRLAEPEDIAGVVAFLLSPAARHMTGETLRVCGGSAMV